MTVAICVDDNNGMLFNNRRLSRDRELINDLFKLCIGKNILINNFSYALFSETNEKIFVDDNFLSIAGKNDVCFVENIDINKYFDKIDRIILYHWNRKYPSDMKLNIDLSHYKMINREDFAGSSHDNITREEYIKC